MTLDSHTDISAALDIPDFRVDLDTPDTQTPDHPTANVLPHVPSTPDICLGLTGACGGAGVTTLAIQAAMNLRARDPRRAVCLVDLDFESGALAAYLDIAPMVRPEDLRMDPDRVDAQVARSLITEHSSGVHIFALPAELDGNRVANPQTVLAILDALGDIYPTLVLDIPRLWTPWTQAAMGACDRLAMVAELNVPGLHAARTRIRQIEARITRTHPIDVVINKHERRALRGGQRNGLRLSDTTKALRPLDRDVIATIGLDTDIAREAMNCGEPVGTIKPDARICRDVAAMCDVLLPATIPTDRRRSRR